MSYSATRLTCFALLSALEEDLRQHIEVHLGASNPAEVLTEDELEKTQKRRKADRGARDSGSLPELLSYLDFAESYQVLFRHSAKIPNDLLEMLKPAQRRFDKLIPVRNRVAHSRPMEIDDLPNVVDACHDISGGTRRKAWPRLIEVVDKITVNPSYVLGLTVSLPSDPDTAPMNNLPPADFDETGFFGRRMQVNRIKKAIKGAYPVVSILGDGGIGKTSVALKVAYELLDDPDRPFEAIVWVTAKTAILTTNEIRRISGAIEDSMSLFSKAATELMGPVETDPVAELLDYLEHFKVLLILDNLETVLDARLREFLLEIPLGSKIILTSRIGAGVENPVNLGELSEDESANLLQALARIRDVSALKSLDSDSMRRISSAMGGRPAYIKWFVAGVQAGKRPEELLSGNDLFLDYCMSNVYDFLSENARTVIRCMQVLPGARSAAAISYLVDFTADETQATLLELLTTNFVHMGTYARKEVIESTYDLTDFGKSYLEKHHRAQQGDRTRFHAKSRELTELGHGLRAENTASPYDPNTVSIRDSGDFSAAKFLRDAIVAASRSDYTTALEYCDEAQKLTPTYHEAWRVRAYVYSLMLDSTSARSAYEAAYELAPESAPLNYFYACFLLDERVDVGEALRHLRSAARVDEDNPLIIGQIAWAQHLLQENIEAVRTAKHALRLAGWLPEASVYLTVGLRAGVHECRKKVAEGYVDAPLEVLEETVQLVEDASVASFSTEASDRLLQLIELADRLTESAEEDFLARKSIEFRSRLAEKIRRIDSDITLRQIGTIKRLVVDRGFGFIKSGSYEYFFHINDLIDGTQWHLLDAGTQVAFLPGDRGVKGLGAKNVSWID